MHAFDTLSLLLWTLGITHAHDVTIICIIIVLEHVCCIMHYIRNIRYILHLTSPLQLLVLA